MDLDKLRSQLHELGALRDGDDIQIDTVDRIKPDYSESWPKGIHARLRQQLVKNNQLKPFAHQAEAIDISLRGHDVVLGSPTASGKTLAFAIPMLDSLLRNPKSHALMVYPMNALSVDQQEQINGLCNPLGMRAETYNGQTSNKLKAELRKDPPEILLTNPEYLNDSFLAWLDRHWTSFLSDLCFLVIDEMHLYHGYFGTNMALLLRRLFVQLDRLGASPKVFLSSATCANPQEHALNLTGRTAKLLQISKMRPRRHYIFVNPNNTDSHSSPKNRRRNPLEKRIVNATMAILQQKLQVLVFGPSKRFLDQVYIESRRKAKQLGLDPELLAIFYADLPKKQKRENQKKIKAGKVRVTFTTSSLEVGLDIGGLDGVVLAGFPSNIMSAWQQIGRAGRGWDRDAFVLFFAMNDPIDQFFVNNINEFLDRDYDHLVIDPTNEQLIANHVPSLKYELGDRLQTADRHILGDSFYEAARNDRRRSPRYRNYRPQKKLTNRGLRGNAGENYVLEFEGKEIGQIPAMRRFREAYQGAIFPFAGNKYSVESLLLEKEKNTVQLAEARPGRRTDATFRNYLNVRDVFEELEIGDFTVVRGKVSQAMGYVGYRLIDEQSGEVLDRVDVEPDYYNLDQLHAFWVTLPDDSKSVRGLGALEQMFRVGAMFVIPTNRFDTSTWAEPKDFTAYYYENYSGGIGIARKLYNEWSSVLSKGIEIAQNCPCASGCQNCIEPAKSWSSSNVNIDKAAGIQLASRLVKAEQMVAN